MSLGWLVQWLEMAFNDSIKQMMRLFVLLLFLLVLIVVPEATKHHRNRAGEWAMPLFQEM